MRSREIHGDGLEHEADYVRERLEDASGTSEYAAASDRLEQELQDLQAINSEQDRSAHSSEAPSTTASASTDEERMSLRRGGALDATNNSPVDAEQLPPESEARAGITERINQSGGR